MPTAPAPARLLATPENRSALAAIQDMLFGLTAGANECGLVYLHGPAGSGKSCLLAALIEELGSGPITVCSLRANDFADLDDLTEARQADLLVIEDLQHLPTRFFETLIALLDERGRLGVVTIVTALCGPAVLRHRGAPIPLRLTTRLAAGLVVALDPLQAPSRRRLLVALAQQAKLNLAPEILDWLADSLPGGGRPLHGAIRQLKALQRLQTKPVRLDEVRAHFGPQVDASAPTAQRIAEQVSECFHIVPKLLLSARQSRDVVLPRQVGMYLARQLTRMSLQKIGKFFGGRDHKTVQHACRKVETAMERDTRLCGVVRQLRMSLS